MKNTYIKEKFRKHIKKDISTVFELGAWDGLFARGLQEVYSPKEIHLFECNSKVFPVIERNIANLTNVFLHKHAVLDYDGEVSFYPIKTTSPNNRYESGPSSIFKTDHSRPSVCTVNLSQTETTVPCKTLDTFCKEQGIDKVDLICADIEGAEYLAFKDQDILHTTDYIITEVQVHPDWVPGRPTIEDLEGSLSKYGFKLKELILTIPNMAGDALYCKE